jgi:hypothetical protein
MQAYYLDIPLNIANRPFTKEEVHAIITERVPCGKFFISVRELSGSSQTDTGSGSYIKRAESSCFIEVLDERGTCQGLMASLFHDLSVRAAS